MKCRTIKEKAYCIDIRNRIGRPCLFGDLTFSVSNFGENNEFSGIYQKRYLKSLKREGKQIVKMRHYYPINPKTFLQQGQQEKMRVAMEYRKSLIFQGKNDLIKSLTTSEKRGLDVLVSKILKERPNNWGIFLFGDFVADKYLV